MDLGVCAGKPVSKKHQSWPDKTKDYSKLTLPPSTGSHFHTCGFVNESTVSLCLHAPLAGVIARGDCRRCDSRVALRVRHGPHWPLGTHEIREQWSRLGVYDGVDGRDFHREFDLARVGRKVLQLQGWKVVPCDRDNILATVSFLIRE